MVVRPSLGLFEDSSSQDVFVHIKDCVGGQPAQGDVSPGWKSVFAALVEAHIRLGRVTTREVQGVSEECVDKSSQAKNVNGGSAPRTQDAMMGKAEPDMQPEALFLAGHSS